MSLTRLTRTAVIALLALASTAGRLCASEVCGGPFEPGADFQARAQETRAQALKTAKIGLVIGITASRLVFRHHLSVAPGTKVVDAVRAAYSVEQGLVCCDSRDIKCVNGLCVDPYAEKWWTIKVNGNAQNSSSQTALKDGDMVELAYEERAGPVAAHVRLEDWVTKIKNEDSEVE